MAPLIDGLIRRLTGAAVVEAHGDELLIHAKRLAGDADASDARRELVAMTVPSRSTG